MENIDFGKTFKQIRKDRGLTLEEVSYNVMSRSTLSDFENKNKDIRFSNMRGLLDNMNMAYYEMLYIHNEFELNKVQSVWQQILKYYNERNISALKSLLKRLEAEYGESEIKSIYDRLNYLQWKNIVSKLDKKYRLSRVEGKEIADYLLRLTYWNTYDTTLFINVLEIFKTERLVELSNLIIRKTSQFEEIPSHKQMIVVLLSNTANQLISRGEFCEGQKFLKQAEERVSEMEVYERLRLNFIRGELEYAEGDVSEGIKKMEFVMETFRGLGCHFIADGFQEDYERTKEKFKKA